MQLAAFLISLASLGLGFAIFFEVVRTKRLVFSKLIHLETRSWDNVSLLASELTGGIPLPYHGGWRVTPDFIAHVIAHVRKHRPSLVVELGSGVSTYWLARALDRNGHGALISVDHDEQFISETVNHIHAVGFSEIVDFRISHLMGNSPWYDSETLRDIAGVDLLVVDGPPINLGANRGMALRFFSERLNDGAVIFFDDASRAFDKASIEDAISGDERFAIEHFESEKGICVVKFSSGSGQCERVLVKDSSDRV